MTLISAIERHLSQYNGFSTNYTFTEQFILGSDPSVDIFKVKYDFIYRREVKFSITITSIRQSIQIHIAIEGEHNTNVMNEVVKFFNHFESINNGNNLNSYVEIITKSV